MTIIIIGFMALVVANEITLLSVWKKLDEFKSKKEK